MCVCVFAIFNLVILMCAPLWTVINSMSIYLSGIRYQSQSLICHLLTLEFGLFNQELDPVLSYLIQKQEIK